MSDMEAPAPLGYDFFADVEGTRSVAHTLEAGVRFQTLSNALMRLEQNLHGLPARLQGLRGRGVTGRPALGDEVARQTQRLQEASAQAHGLIASHQQALQPRVEALWEQIEQNDRQIEHRGYEANAPVIAAAKQEGDTLKKQMEEAEATIHASFNDIANELRSLEQHVTQLERAADALARATFALQAGEALVEASEGSYQASPNEVAEGVLFLTDRRLLFEQRQDVTRKGRFLPFSKSQRVEEVRFEEPLDHVASVEAAQGRGDTLQIALKGERRATFVLKNRVQPWQQLIDEARAASSK